MAITEVLQKTQNYIAKIVIKLNINKHTNSNKAILNNLQNEKLHQKFQSSRFN
jgi:hypothetical protein